MNRPLIWIAIAATSALVTHRALASFGGSTAAFEPSGPGPVAPPPEDDDEEGEVLPKTLTWADPASDSEFEPTTGLPTRVVDRAHLFRLVLVLPGTFVRGMRPEEVSSPFEPSRHIARNNEFPAHSVQLTQPYYLGETEVTQKQWDVVMGSRPACHDAGDNYPIECVQLQDVRDFLAKTGYRLPTEAEWEYACRADEPAPLYSSEAPRLAVEAVAWTSDNSGSHTKPVKTRQPNGFGLYDMYGNVSEMCSDLFNDGSYIEALELGCVDPKGAERGNSWLLRGSNCHQNFECARPSKRENYGGGRDGAIGFRLARTP